MTTVPEFAPLLWRDLCIHKKMAYVFLHYLYSVIADKTKTEERHGWPGLVKSFAPYFDAVLA